MLRISRGPRIRTLRIFTSLSHSNRLSTSFPLKRGSSSEPAKMSWMDSWSRPSKSQATPAPFYLLPGGEATPYCHSCGRVISTRKTTASAKTNTPVKYCSSRCRTQKPGKLDRELEKAFLKLLTAEEHAVTEKKSAKGTSGKHKKGKNSKGDNRILVSCSAAEEIVFGPNRTSTEEGHEETHSEDETPRTSEPTQAMSEPRTSEEDLDLADILKDENDVDGDVLARMSVRSGTRIRPAQSVSQVNGSVGGEKGRAERIHETDEMLEKRRQGQRRARERELTKCAARRGVVFGFSVNEDGEKRLCEAVMSGKVVEPSFAKGDWAIRWRES